MTLDGGGGDNYDPTPGNFRGDAKPMKVSLDSLFAFGNSYAMQTESYFGMLTAFQLTLIKSDVGKGPGHRAIGNTDTFSELVTVANYSATSAEKAEKLTSDLKYGNLALASAASWMAEKYGAMDGFNAVKTADAVADAFSPPADAKNTIASKRAADEKRAAERAEAKRLASLPVVDPSDVKFYHMSGLVEGKDFVIGDPNAKKTPPPPDPNDPTTAGTDNKGDKKKGDPFYMPPEERDYDPTHTYTPPTPPMDDGEIILAPGAEPGGGSSQPSGTVA